ncbi:MAG TPA: DEAD/DEAH box helicase, partial [Chloroflexi bacterium]|nr:DEAD/DEAH box helicase [Chloroflexota bacterium]
MATQIHPIEAAERIRADYARYLRTIYFFRDEELRRQFWEALDAPRFLLRGPILEASPPFKKGRSIGELIDAGILHRDFRRLCSGALPLDRPLYLHQDRAIEKVVRDQRNVVVATGTGSGKTESFLIPIFDHLLRQREAGLLKKPGVRALLLYPMNALANDQLKRLRHLLAHFPEITFGRYTGETEEERGRAEALFQEQFPRDPLLPNELICREEMRVAPPHLLITNYAMLEYLLLRPRDSEFFDGPTGQFWRFIALDEAHVYDGASGIEIAMLLRRLKDRVVASRPGHLQYIATSATLGRGREDFPDVVGFASEIFGAPFEWADSDPDRQDVVAGEREPLAAFEPSWGDGTPVLYAALDRAIAEQAPLPTLAEMATTHEVPVETVGAARRLAAGTDDA